MKQKSSAVPMTKSVTPQAALNAAQKGAQQLAQAVKQESSAPQEQSSKRQAEAEAGGAVCETVSMTVYGVDRVARVSTRALQHRHERREAMPESLGRELAKTRAKERSKGRKRGGEAMSKADRVPNARPGKPARKPRNAPAPRLRDASAPLGKAAQTASGTATRARLLAVRSSQTTRASVRGIKAIAKKLAAAVKAIGTALQSLTAALAAGGTAAVILVLFICLIGMVAGSSFGLFFAAQPAGNGASLQSVVQQLGEDYYVSIRDIEQNTAHDKVVYLPDDVISIRWEDVLSVFAADMAAANNGQPVAVLESAQIDRLREILQAMNPVSQRTYTEDHDEEQTIVDEDGNETIQTVTVTETILEITVQHHTPQEMATALGFTARQDEQLTLLSDPQNQVLWMELLGGFVSSGGQIITPGAVPAGTGIFQWPLPDAYSITSDFGEREDPYSGETSSHTGTDIAAPQGTPILAAADGTVTIANATDPWGGSYGYYIKVDHGNGFDTLYAHCSAICVVPGQTVRQGEVIGYVGHTGRATGDHLHLEVRVNGERSDAMGYFAA